MSSVEYCSLVSSHFYEDFMRPPLEEARLQFVYATLQTNDLNRSAAPSLVDRVVHLAASTLLMIPFVNWVIYAVMNYFSWDIEGCFLRAIDDGDGALISLYLETGINLDDYGQDLLFETDNYEAIRFLLQNEHDFSLRDSQGIGLPEHLVMRGKELFLDGLVDEGLIELAPFLSQKDFLKAKDEGNETYLRFMIEKGYVGSDTDFEGVNVSCSTDLVSAAFNHDKKALSRLAKELSFDEFCHSYLDLKERYPLINTEWMWNTLFKIPLHHYRSFKDIGKLKEIEGDPPEEVSLLTLTRLFDKINFNDPHGDFYIEESVCIETLDGTPYMRSPEYLREGLVFVREKITGSRVDETRADIEEMRDHRRYLDWVIYCLQQGPFNDVKARVLIDIGKAGHVCVGRWKELFYECRCRILGEEVEELDLEDQVMGNLGQLRALFIYQLVETKAKQCTHARDNLFYHLKERRGLPGDKPRGVFDEEGIKFRAAEEAQRAFDSLYTPAAQIAHISDLARARGQSAQDFDHLLIDAMNERFATKFQSAPLSLLRSALANQPERMTYGAIETLFKGFDRDYTMLRPKSTAGYILERLEEDPLFRGLTRFFSWPAPEEVTGTEQVSNPQQQIENFLKAQMTTDQGSQYNRLKVEANGGDQQAQQAFDEFVFSLRQGFSHQIRMEYMNLRRTLGAGATTSPIEAIKKLFEEKISINEDCTLDAFIHSSEFESLKSFIDLEDLQSLLNKRVSEVKTTVISLLVDTVFSIAPYETSYYFERFQKDAFLQVARPLKENGEYNLPDEVLHPLALGIFLKDLGHLEWQDPDYFAYSFLG